MKVFTWVALLSAVLGLAGCQSISLPGEPSIGNGSAVEDDYVQSDDPQRLGREHFARGNYALAEKYFQAAVERSPQDGDSWVGLAASYDQLGRFDLADRAYDGATAIKGATFLILNNRGYSYLLRGDGIRAAGYFQQALAMRPGNATVRNNMSILRRSTASP